MGKIQTLKDSLEVEKLVSQRMQEFISKKKAIVEQLARQRDELKDKKVKDLNNLKEEIQSK